MPDPVRRLESIDRLRGLIMIVMAIDHASYMIGRFHSGEMWAGMWTRYASPVAFLTRFVTHFCAPGFFFLMGVGISLRVEASSKQGWSGGRISRFLATRGLLLVLVSFFVELPAWMSRLARQPGAVVLRHTALQEFQAIQGGRLVLADVVGTLLQWCALRAAACLALRYRH